MKKYIFALSVSLISLTAYGQDALSFCDKGVPAGKKYPGDKLYPNSDYPHFHCFKGDKVQGNSQSKSEVAYLQKAKKGKECVWNQDKVNALAGGTPGNLSKMVDRYNKECEPEPKLVAPK